MAPTQPPTRKRLSLLAVLRARCPACQTGRVTENLLQVKPHCLECGYNFHPESGFYLGAIAVGFLITAGLTIPPMIVLKLMEVEMEILLGFPFLEFLFLGTFLTFYSKIIWLHLEYQLTQRLGTGPTSSDTKNSNSQREE